MHRLLAVPQEQTKDGMTGPLRVAAGRLDSVDQLRGLVIVLMTLDHVRDFFSDIPYDPLDLSKTSLALFLTRWITHFCAPTFIFLAGMGAYLSFLRGKAKRQVAWFLFSRGLWIVVLEVTIVRCLGWVWDFDLHDVMGSVLWAIGWSMVALAPLIFLPTSLVAAIGLTLIAYHNCFDGFAADDFGRWGGLWSVLHAGGSVEWMPGYRLVAAYPLLPWIGVMATGYAMGAVYQLEPARRRAALLCLGLALSLAFVALRYLNVYGDPDRWSYQQERWLTICSFSNCHKYPPSLLYVLMTLGPAVTALGLFQRPPGFLGRRLVTFGRVPMFFYLLHVPLIHSLAFALAVVRYGPEVLNKPFFPSDYGYNLPMVYALWLVVLLMLYPLCAWYGGVKRRRQYAWLSYL
jgi:uncharacterized membrane protein